MDKTSLTVLYFLVILYTTSCINFDYEEKCMPELCVPITNCPKALEIFRKENIPEKYRCGFEKLVPKICCTLASESIVFIENTTDNVSAKPRPSITTTPTPEAVTKAWEHTTLEAVRLKPSTLSTPEDATKTLEHTTTEANKLDLNTTTTSTTETINKLEPSTTERFASDPFPNRNICGRITHIGDRIYGGENTDFDEYPWLARIKYRKSSGREIFSCSASLITDRYLVTAAHCLINHNARPISIRLGEWDEQTVIDCQNNRCSEESIDIGISETIIHPAFQESNQLYADIALILLEKPVNFSDFISPICLPTTDYMKMQDYVTGTSYWTAGWGLTEFDAVSHIKRKVNLNVVPSDICTTIYPEIPAETFSQVICAGGRKGKDSCRGDSGGPLMREAREEDEINLYLFGITSSGAAECGTEGYPGIYTRVSKYMEWIRATISKG